jgi:hypothetical protein
VRHDAARSATERARSLVQTDRSRAEQLLNLARHFDPDYEPARKLLAELSPPPPAEPVRAPPAPSAASAAPRPSKSKLPRVGPQAAPAPPAPPAAAEPTAAPSSTGGGRWL